ARTAPASVYALSLHDALPIYWVTVITARGEAEGRALVTRRLKPLEVAGRTIYQIGFPWHFGYAGTVRGDASNDLIPLVADPNVSDRKSTRLNSSHVKISYAVF